MKRPNFFIVGAPKCGTTALGAYLAEHPQVYFSPVKEPNFFAPDISPGSSFSDLTNYLQLFAGASNEHVAVGEATPYYLRSDRAVPAILEFNPTAKLIVMLRNPLEAAYAFYSNHMYWGIEVVGSFEKAWQLQCRRAGGDSVPFWCPSVPVLQYGWFYRLGEQIERLFALVPRDQVLVILFDDFVAGTKSVYDRVLDFLGLQNEGRTDFRPINVNRNYRMHFIAYADVFLRRLPPSLQWSKALVKGFLGVKSLRLHRLLHDLNQTANVVRGPRPSLPEHVRSELHRYFADDVAKLSCLLERDLSVWLGPIDDAATNPAPSGRQPTGVSARNIAL